ncbi:hypothetical protein GF420_09120 [candidate division GN15 bacterium]|nr:hypothetical protein [candidate division GN15 bacterium]
MSRLLCLVFLLLLFNSVTLPAFAAEAAACPPSARASIKVTATVEPKAGITHGVDAMHVELWGSAREAIQVQLNRQSLPNNSSAFGDTPRSLYINRSLGISRWTESAAAPDSVVISIIYLDQ